MTLEVFIFSLYCLHVGRGWRSSPSAHMWWWSRKLSIIPQAAGRGHEYRGCGCHAPLSQCSRYCTTLWGTRIIMLNLAKKILNLPYCINKTYGYGPEQHSSLHGDLLQHSVQSRASRTQAIRGLVEGPHLRQLGPQWAELISDLFRDLSDELLTVFIDALTVVVNLVFLWRRKTVRHLKQ